MSNKKYNKKYILFKKKKNIFPNPVVLVDNGVSLCYNVDTETKGRHYMDALIIVDMQNDFVYGSLANPAAQAIVEPIAEFIKNFDGKIIATLDTHYDNYLATQEGKFLPIPHCIFGSEGHNMVSVLDNAITSKNRSGFPKIFKKSFGCDRWKDIKAIEGMDRFILVGTCTDICVISNALILKAFYPEKEVIVLEDLCAGLTEEKHKAALEVMKSCQVIVKNSKEWKSND